MSLVLQVIGALIVAGGLALLAPWLGVVALGLFVIVAGVIAEVEEQHGPAESD